MRIAIKLLLLTLAVCLLSPVSVAQDETIQASWITKLILAAREQDIETVEEIVESEQFNPAGKLGKDDVPIVTMVYMANVVAGGDKSAQMLRIVSQCRRQPQCHGWAWQHGPSHGCRVQGCTSCPSTAQPRRRSRHQEPCGSVGHGSGHVSRADQDGKNLGTRR